MEVHTDASDAILLQTYKDGKKRVVACFRKVTHKTLRVDTIPTNSKPWRW